MTRDSSAPRAILAAIAIALAILLGTAAAIASSPILG